MKFNIFGYTLETVTRNDSDALNLFWFDNYWDDLICLGLPGIVILFYWDKQ
jgi:hypothetical protein